MTTIEEKIVEFARKRRIQWRKHALIRMLQRGIYRQEVLSVIEKAEIIERYPEDKPFPSFLLFGKIRGGVPIHIVTSVDERDEMLWIITVYRSSSDRWQPHFKRRKEK